VVAALAAWHEQHEAAAGLLERVQALPAHVATETYSVLTRLPGGLAVAPNTASDLLARRFPGKRLRLSARENSSLVATLADAGVYGGATYDGLVALEAAAHGELLVTLDQRAQRTYGRLGVPFRALSA
jgi:predicted nucleic acid-binding protein